MNYYDKLEAAMENDSVQKYREPKDGDIIELRYLLSTIQRERRTRRKIAALKTSSLIANEHLSKAADAVRDIEEEIIGQFKERAYGLRVEKLERIPEES